ncbi:Protein CBG26721 [Caenorhabditis briggsae]
MCLLG